MTASAAADEPRRGDDGAWLPPGATLPQAPPAETLEGKRDRAIWPSCCITGYGAKSSARERWGPSSSGMGDKVRYLPLHVLA